MASAFQSSQKYFFAMAWHLCITGRAPIELYNSFAESGEKLSKAETLSHTVNRPLSLLGLQGWDLCPGNNLVKGVSLFFFFLFFALGAEVQLIIQEGGPLAQAPILIFF